MREAGARAPGALRIVDDLRGESVAAVVYAPLLRGGPLLRLNKAIVSSDEFDRVLLWSRRELAQGKPVSWLLAGELADLA